MCLRKIDIFPVRFLKKVKDFLAVINITMHNNESVINPLFKEISSDEQRPLYNYPKIIWIYWHSADNIPEVVKICIERIRFFCPDYKINILNESNVSDFIDLPEVPKDLPIAIVADLIRLMLLEKYGGVWMDSSIFLNEDLGWVYSEIDNHDAFVFYSDECTLDESNPVTENWFIIAPENSKFIKCWLKEFSACIFSGNPTAYYNSEKNDKGFIQKLTKPDYLLCYISAMKVTRENRFNILYASSASVGHYFNYKHKFNGYYVAAELTLKNESNIEKVKLIKLNSGSRDEVERNLSSGKLREGSYISNVINQNYHKEGLK